MNSYLQRIQRGVNMNQVNEMVANMKAFAKEKYKKSELLEEMFNLQEEIVNLTFNDERATTEKLRIWDAVNHLEQLNQSCGNVADEEFQKFKDESKMFSNLIKAEVSGKRGEDKAYRALQNIHSKSIILRNVELSDGNNRTELDAVVITSEAITIVEVKNTSKNIFIDENGDYYRTGEFLRLDCNIAEKMMLKEKMLRKVLVSDGIENIQIRSIVVFTNNRIEVQNKYAKISTCFLSQLSNIIDGFKSDYSYSDEVRGKIERTIKKAESKECYPFELDVEQYKFDFATLMVILEDASTKEIVKCEEEESFMAKTNNLVWEDLKKYFVVKCAGYAGSAAAITLISTMALGAIRRGGLR
jgi:hypothetical protein